jgi:hypothetical protein
MNPIPPISSVPIEGLGAPLQGVVLEAVGFLVIVVIVAFAALLLAIRHGSVVRERLRCPQRRKRATVTFRIAGDGTRTDVMRCSLVRGGRESFCGKICLHGAAPA